MKYRDLREFCAALEVEGELRRVVEPVSTRLEMTALSDRVLRSAGPALWFERPVDAQGRFSAPALTNLFGTPRRVALGMGANVTTGLCHKNSSLGGKPRRFIGGWQAGPGGRG